MALPLNPWNAEMDKNEFKSILKQSLPTTISLLLTISIVAVVGLCAWGAWHAWSSYSHWKVHVKDKPVTLNGVLFTDLILADLEYLAHDEVDFRLAHVKFLMHYGHETGVIRNPESLRSLRRSLKQSTKNISGKDYTPLDLLIGEVRDLHLNRFPGPENQDLSLCAVMYNALLNLSNLYENFHDIYGHWTVPKFGAPAWLELGNPDSPWSKDGKEICYL